MDETHDARRNIEAARDSMSEIAEELLFRSSPAHLKTRAKEAAVRKTAETSERVRSTIRENPTALKLIGGALGVGLASMLSKRIREPSGRMAYGGRGLYGGRGMYGRGAYGREAYGSDSYDRDVNRDIYERNLYGGHERVDRPGWQGTEAYGGPPGVAYAYGEGDTRQRYDEAGASGEGRLGQAKEAAQEKVSHAKEVAQEKVSHAKDVAQEKLSHAKDVAQEKFSSAQDRTSERSHQLRDRAHDLRERIPPRDELKTRTQDAWHRRVESDPIPILLGSIALGALASLLIPVSDRERSLTAPARDKARGKLEEARQQAVSRLEQVRGQAGDTLSSFKDQAAETLQGKDSGSQGVPSTYHTNLPH